MGVADGVVFVACMGLGFQNMSGRSDPNPLRAELLAKMMVMRSADAFQNAALPLQCA